MDTGFKLSLAGHGTLLAVSFIGWPFGGPTTPPEPVVMDVALYQPGDLTLPPGPTPQAEDAPEATPVAPPPPPAEDTQPDAPAPEADTAPRPDPVPPLPPPVDRVAPVPQPAPPEDVRTGDIVQPEVSASPEPAPDAPPAQEQDATAPEAAAPEIVTEATETGDTPAPRARPDRPEPPADVAQTPPPDPAPAPDPDPAPPSPPPADAVSDAVTAALAEALGGGGTPGARDGNIGGSLSNADRDGLRLAVSRCWNVGALGTDAMQVVVTVGMDMSRDGAPSNLRLVTHAGGSAAAAEQAYDTARRAILRCAPFDLPQDRYDQWRRIEMTFNPADMGRR